MAAPEHAFYVVRTRSRPFTRKEQQLYDGAERKAMARKWCRPLIILIEQQWFSDAWRLRVVGLSGSPLAGEQGIHLAASGSPEGPPGLIGRGR